MLKRKLKKLFIVFIVAIFLLTIAGGLFIGYNILYKNNKYSGRILIASDHGGYALKEYIKRIDFSDIEAELGTKIEIVDYGTYSTESVHYPVYAKKMLNDLVRMLPNKLEDDPKNFGILVCTTGIGMCMVANKYDGVRGALVHSITEAEMTRKHNNANVLCLGQKHTDSSAVEGIVKTFIKTHFEGNKPEGKRHLLRLQMFN